MYQNMKACNSIPGYLLLFLLLPALAIEPQTKQAPTTKPAPGDILYERMDGDPGELITFPPSIFPHWRHRIQYRCDACHDRLFKMQLGATPVTMDSMKNEENCGACHNGKLAFSAGFENCNRCHVAVGK